MPARHASRWWHRAVAALLALAALLGAALWVLTAPRPLYEPGATALQHRVGNAERGRLVFAAGDCASCHASPGQADRLRLGGGLVIESPYGTMHVPNISSDPADGIGTWTTVDLANALLSGVSPARHHYYPVFPYSSYAKMSLDDVVDLMAYLRTLPAGSWPPAAARPHVSLQRAARHRRLEAAVLRSSSDRAGREPECGVESRPLPGGRARALRRMPFLAQSSRRRQTGRRAMRAGGIPREPASYPTSRRPGSAPGPSTTSPAC